MKYILTFLIACFSLASQGQLVPGTKTAKTSTLPEGTSVVNGKIKVMSGYKAFFSEKDSRILIIQKNSNLRTAATGAITGTFSCYCFEDNATDDCSLAYRQNEVFCLGSKCGNCIMNVTIKPKSGLAITRETKGEVWKEFVFPKKKQ